MNGFDSRDERALETTAAELARWQGRTETAIAENTRRLDGINGSMDKIEANVNSIMIEIGVIRTKVALWAGIGGLVGAGIISAAIGIGLGG